MHGEAFQRTEEEPATEGAAEQQGPNHLFDLAPARNPGHKHGHARRIGNPPQPVEHCPTAAKAAVSHGVGKQTHLQEILRRQTDSVNGVINGEFGRADQQYQCGEDKRPPADHFAQSLHAAVDTNVRAEAENYCGQ